MDKGDLNYTIDMLNRREKMKVHELKIMPAYFEAIVAGKKNFEIRKNDRDFQVGDKLILKELETGWGKDGDYTGRQIEKYVKYILYGGEYGLDSAYCIMALEDDYEDIKAKICDNYCSKRKEWTGDQDDFIEEICVNCPLSNL